MFAKILKNKVVQYPVDPFLDNTNVSFPIGWNGGNINGTIYATVYDSPVPTTTAYEKVVENSPTLGSDGQWYRNYTVQAVSVEEKVVIQERLWENIRYQRGEKLAFSDWTQLPDSPLTTAKKSEWAQYRQDLRDLPSKIVDPAEVVWPAQPQ